MDNTMPNQHKMFYGWWIVVASSIILFVSSGIGFYGHGVLLDPLCHLHGWSKATLSSAVSLFFFTNGFFGMLIGRKIDQHGPRTFLVVGSVMIGTGFCLLSRITQVYQLYAVYLLMSFGFSCTSIPPSNTLITNWFIRKRGLAMSIANTGLSVGGVVMVPLASYLILHLGLATTLPILGGIYCAVIIPTAIVFIKPRPADINQFPDGDSEPGGCLVDGALGNATQMRVWTRRQAIQTVAFWAIATAFLLALGGQIAYLVHQISFLTEFMGGQRAAMAVSITACASIMGRLFLGTFVDRLDKRYVAMVCFLLQGLAVIALAYYHHPVILYLGTFMFGLTMGPILMLQSLIIGECFGLVSFATVSGAIGLLSMPGAAFGPIIAGAIFDATQSYRIAFSIFAGASFAAMIGVYFARPPRMKSRVSE